MKRIAWGVAALPVVLAAIWCGFALGMRLPGPTVIRHGAGGLFVGAVVGLLVWMRPLARKLAYVALLFLAWTLWWTFLVRASNDRDWSPEVARPPVGTIEGDKLTIKNVRNFDYRSETDFTERWETRSYDLANIKGADLFLSYWGSPNIAHTIMSWDFVDGPPLVISIETRKERGEEYSAVRGFFREYELYYVVADERDPIRLRTNYRDEQVYLYRLRARPEVARALLLDYVKTMNEIAAKPQWYNALVDNCTTGIRVHVQNVGAARPWDWRLLINGHADELLYERGVINTALPFAELKQASNVVARAKAADQDPSFSARIRDGLPPRPAPLPKP